jgi:carbamoylphosphate synthase large subunit
MSLIKQDNPDFYIIGSNENRLSVLSTICDEWYVEPAVKGNDYVDFCLDFCRDHSVNVFMPRREMLSISRRKADFEAAGVKVMVDDYEIVDILNYKDKAYRELVRRGVSTIPEYHIVTNLAGFEEAYEDLSKKYREVCIKFVHDEGGKSYRLIDNSRRGYAALFKKQNTRMTYDAIHEALSERDEFSPLMVMPNLSGDEVSVDCLNTASGLIMIPRIKNTTRVERLCFNEDILLKTRELFNAVKLECPCNIQFKYLDGVPYFLEVNTRMSGGVQMACLASGVNIPSIAVNKLIGIEKEWKICMDDRAVSHVEIPVIL